MVGGCSMNKPSWYNNYMNSEDKEREEAWAEWYAQVAIRHTYLLEEYPWLKEYNWTWRDTAKM